MNNQVAHDSADENAPIYVVGDVHGEYNKLVGLLQHAALIGDDLAWTGGNAVLWFMGDLFDRGPGGLATIDLVMRLQQEAPVSSGRVSSLLGNHDMLIIAARDFSDTPIAYSGMSFRSIWQLNGGHDADMEGLTPDHIAWLKDLPAMALEGGRLLLHADGSIYTSYGSSIEEVNQAFQAALYSEDHADWIKLEKDFAQRYAFYGRDKANPKEGSEEGRSLAVRFLQWYGGRQLIHGHTLISDMTRQKPEEITEPLIYAGGLCVNVDGGMCEGGPGFVYHLPPLSAKQPKAEEAIGRPV
ncbi:MAG TPA: metallophosphoesterase [Chloroflexia bacterium]|nr:metallophosphoesterase [Chloroflexia bacterium]